MTGEDGCGRWLKTMVMFDEDDDELGWK